MSLELQAEVPGLGTKTFSLNPSPFEPLFTDTVFPLESLFLLSLT